jgi:hypothetical protein
MSDEIRDATVIEAEPARPMAPVTSSSRGDRARASAYRRRFGLVYFLLAVVAGGAVAAFAVIVTRPSAAPTAPWSAWQPTGSDSAKAKQIAARIPKAYHLGNGAQLTAALVGPPQVAAGSGQGNIPVRAIAIRPDTSTGKQEASDIKIIDANGSLMYILCGLGQNCSIKGGKASEARHVLLQRQALELALYTFKYVHDVKAITIFLPPRPDGATSGTSIFLSKSDVRRELSMPLARTIGPVAPAIGKISPAELATLDRITRPRLYTYEYQQAQDGSAVLVLNPITAGA